MRLNQFDLNLLVALDALLREKNVTRAAERVHLSQPAMSAALAKLREYFRDPLLVRVGRELDVTPRGRALSGPVQQLLANAHGVLGSQAAFDPAVDRRTFSVMSPDSITPWLMPPLLRWLEQLAPGIRLEVERPSVPGLARLAYGEVHLLVAVDGADSLGVPAMADSLCSAFVSRLRWSCVVAAGHPAVSGRLTQQEFLCLPHVVLRAYGEPALVEQTARKRYDVDLDVRVVTESVFDVPHLVSNTSLIGIVPEHLARLLAGHHGVKLLDLPEGLIPSSRLDLLWPRCHHGDAGHAWLRDLILSGAARLPASESRPADHR